jgi:hypothetical protein
MTGWGYTKNASPVHGSNIIEKGIWKCLGSGSWKPGTPTFFQKDKIPFVYSNGHSLQ